MKERVNLTAGGANSAGKRAGSVLTAADRFVSQESCALRSGFEGFEGQEIGRSSSKWFGSALGGSGGNEC